MCTVVLLPPGVNPIAVNKYIIHNYNFCCCVCGCETWSVTRREGRRLRVFENRVLRKIFGPERDKVTGEWRRLHNEELNCTPRQKLRGWSNREE